MSDTGTMVRVVWKKYGWDFTRPVLEDADGILIVEFMGSHYEVESLELLADYFDYID